MNTLTDPAESSAPVEVAAEQPRTSAPATHRLVPLAVWLVTLLTLGWIPMKILSLGFLPPDDALRHVAKAVDQRPWGEILVLRPDFQMDHNPGWHWLLGQIHRGTEAGPEGLLMISVVGLFTLALIVPLLGFRWPEAWLGGLLASMLTFPDVIYRVLLGRPLALSMAVTLYVLLAWRNQARKQPTAGLLVGTTLLLAASTWLHGSWYLFSLVVAAFALARQWRNALWLGGCWAVGSFLGALLTGHPLAFLSLHVHILLNSFSESPMLRMLVSEYQPTDGSPLAVFTVIALLLWRRVSGRWSWSCLNNPIFLLALLSWILGLRLGRFFSDWGTPALLLWVALELSEHLKRLLPFEGALRLGVTSALALALLFGLTSDTHSRWSRALDVEYLSAEDAAMAPWLPERGGILYAADMSVFYQTFFKNPHAPWRYMLGFEATFMPVEDLRVYRNIQRNFGSYKAYEPWVAKMRPEDRLVIRSASSTPPTIAQLDWHYTARELWVGKKKQ